MLQQEASFPEGKSCAVKVVLIVEDDPGIAEFLKVAIAQETPFKPLVATSGNHALEIVQNVRPQLLILDYGLGHMNGIELYDRLHTIADFDGIPALIMSASLEKHQHEIAQRHLVGIEKPLELDDFLDVVSELLEERSSQLL